MFPPVRCSTPGLTSMRLLLSVDYMSFYHRLVSNTEFICASSSDRGLHLSSPHIVIHSVLASRILFKLRESEGNSGTHQTLIEVSDIRFEGGQLSMLRSEEDLKAGPSTYVSHVTYQSTYELRYYH